MVMEIRQVTENFAVAGQIAPEHVAQIAGAGFKSLVCNRPDSEAGAVPHDEIEAAAKKAGLKFSYLPVVSGQITEEDVSGMAKLMGELPGPILAYCRTGGRCANLFLMVQQARAQA
jgi:uncharacterized protein (TIGR01244 family)